MLLSRHLACLALIGLVAAAPGRAAPASSDRPLDADVNERLRSGLATVLDTSGVASISVARIEDDRIVALHAVGESAPGQPATVQTRYNVASLTKPVAAETVLRLVAEGKVALDASMATAWVDPDVAHDPRHRQLTPRLALAHQTGFANWRDDAGLRFERDPGGAPGYSGEGYEYVAHYVQRLTGTALDRHAERLLFAPLGMTHTSHTTPPADRGVVAGSRTHGTWLAPISRAVPSAADDLSTTAGDYARFLLSAMRNDGLDAALVMERGRVQADKRSETCTGIPASVCPDATGFTLGWELYVFDDVPYFMHTGADVDTFCLAYWTPATRSGTVILTNSQDGYRAILPVLDLVGADPKFVEMLRALASR